MKSGAPLQHEAIPIMLDLRPGVRYWYLSKVKDTLNGNQLSTKRVGPFEVVGYGKNFRTHQEMVAVKRALEPAPLWFITLIDFANDFELVPPLKVEPKVAQDFERGSGV